MNHVGSYFLQMFEWKSFSMVAPQPAENQEVVIEEARFPGPFEGNESIHYLQTSSMPMIEWRQTPSKSLEKVMTRKRP